MSAGQERRRRHDGGKQPGKSKSRADFITMRAGLQEVFISWREGARMPQSFHFSEADAVKLAQARCLPGERIHILRCEIIGSVDSPMPAITYTTHRGQS